jgi:hypothetical protein
MRLGQATNRQEIMETVVSGVSQLMLPQACFGRNRAMERPSEDLCVRIFEARETDVRHRPIADEPVVVEWRSVVKPKGPGFFLPALGQFMTGYLRPSFSTPYENHLTEASALSLLSDGTAAALMAAVQQADGADRSHFTRRNLLHPLRRHIGRPLGGRRSDGRNRGDPGISSGGRVWGACDGAVSAADGGSLRAAAGTLGKHLQRGV